MGTFSRYGLEVTKLISRRMWIPDKNSTLKGRCYVFIQLHFGTFCDNSFLVLERVIYRPVLQ